MERSTDGRLALAAPFAGAAVRYWLRLFPALCREHRRRCSQALAIPDPLSRETALAALSKWGNVEGAVAFAAFVPRRQRAAAARAMACLQTTYNYLDMLSEQPSPVPAAAARSLHEALLAALDPGAEHTIETDHRERSSARADGDYLNGLIADARAALAELPAYGDVAPHVLGAARRIVEFQSANTGQRSESGRREDLAALERWGKEHTPAGSGLRWWETAAAAGSSLGVYALIALAAGASGGTPRACADATVGAHDRDAGLGPDRALDARALMLDRAYFPWIGALHSLLDNLVDVVEDRATVQHNLVGCYASAEEAAARMGLLAERARSAARELSGVEGGRAHELVLGAMASFYLATPESMTPSARPIAAAVLDALRGSTGLTMPVFRARLGVRSLSPVGRRRARGAEIVAPAGGRGRGEPTAAAGGRPGQPAYRVRVREREA